MAHTESSNIDRWVDERLAALTPDHWEPDSAARLAQLHQRSILSARRRLRLAGAAVAATAVCVSLPVTRALGARCVEACVNATTRVGQWFGGSEPDASAHRAAAVGIGDMAPDVIGTDAQGSAVHLASLRGRVVVLNFWATWCAPCVAEIPILNDLRTRFGAQGLEVIGVSIDEDGWSAVTPFAAQHKVGYLMAIGSDEVAAAYGGLDQLPTTFVIDRDGRIVVKRVGLLSEGADYGPIAELVGR